METAASVFPPIIVEEGDAIVRGAGARIGCNTVESMVNADAIVVCLEFMGLPREITRVPERYEVEVRPHDRHGLERGVDSNLLREAAVSLN